MKNFPGGKIALALLALMGLSFVLLVFAKDEKRTNPTVESTYPSGLAAFAELLRRDGYVVKLDKKPRPQLDSGDLVIAVDMALPHSFTELEPKEAKTKDTIDKFIGDGGSELVLNLPSDFQSSSKNMTLQSRRPLAGMAEKQMTKGTYVDESVSQWSSDEPVEVVGDAAATSQWSGRRSIYVHDAMGVTNRFISQGENAEVMLQYVHMLAPAGSRVVFPEALINNVQSDGPLDKLGGWAVAGRTQLYILALVVLTSLAVRFGSPTREAAKQRSARDMVDAVAELLRRGNKTQFALEAALNDTYERFRLGVSAPLCTSREHLRERMPEPLLVVVMEAEKLAAKRLPDDSWAARSKTMPMARALDFQATNFEKDTRQRRQPVS